MADNIGASDELSYLLSYLILSYLILSYLIFLNYTDSLNSPLKMTLPWVVIQPCTDGSGFHLVETLPAFRTEASGSCQIHSLVSKAWTKLKGRHAHISSTYSTDSWCEILPTIFHERPRSISNHVLYIIILTICTWRKQILNISALWWIQHNIFLLGTPLFFK